VHKGNIGPIRKKLFLVFKDSLSLCLLRFHQLKEQYEGALSRNDEELNQLNFRFSIILKKKVNRNNLLSL